MQALGFTFPDEVDWRDSYAKAPGCSRGSSGCLSPVGILIWRIALFLVWLACFVWSIIDWTEDYDADSYFIKMTHWSVLLELLYLMLLVSTTGVAVLTFGEKRASTGTPCYVSVTWALGALLPSMSLAVFILYWSVVYQENNDFAIVNVVTHGVNWIIVLLDFLTTRQPFLLWHVYLPMIMGVVYTLFTLIYLSADGKNEDGVNTYIYKVMDWKNDAGLAIGFILLSAFIGVPGAHLAHWSLRRCCSSYTGKDSNLSAVQPLAFDSEVVQPPKPE